jgi:hypothetical protein
MEGINALSAAVNSNATAAVAIPTPSFAQITGGAGIRSRTGSVKRMAQEDPPYEPSYVSKAMDHWGIVTKSMTDTKKQLVEHPDHGVANSLCSIFFKGFCDLEKALTSVSQLQFDMAKDLDSTKSMSLKNNSVIDQNRAGGNIVSSVEKSSAYEKVCTEIKTTANYCKVLNIDFETELKTHTDIVQKARDILNQAENIKEQINSVQIVPLGNSTKLYEGKNSVPILIKTSNKEEKLNLESEIKNAGLKTSFHWPKSIMKHVKSIRSQLANYHDETIDLRTQQIMIRPSYDTGKNLNISYRAEGGANSKWTLLETVKTPVEDNLLKQFKGSQICKSKYFKI